MEHDGLELAQISDDVGGSRNVSRKVVGLADKHLNQYSFEIDYFYVFKQNSSVIKGKRKQWLFLQDKTGLLLKIRGHSNFSDSFWLFGSRFQCSSPTESMERRQKLQDSIWNSDKTAERKEFFHNKSN